MRIITALLMSFFILPVHAGVVIYGTRIIYPEKNREVLVQLMNQSKNASLIQAWIDDGNTTIAPEKIQVPFILTPPVSRVAGGSGQQLKIRKMPNNLPHNKESLFYLSVLDIPPNNPQNAGKNKIKLALQNRIKLLWRPSGIAPVDKKSFSQLNIKKKNNAISINNETANWITITTIKAQNVKVNNESILLPPFSNNDITLKNNHASEYELTVVDDYGNNIHSNIAAR
ncbi:MULTISPECIES: fimbria/pilus periplasmic chaperone [Enterobacteriaceae]|uniref:Molecular chaperone n=1 Tax=Shigella sonnei TaxID=624 RepID=A0A8B3K601_SHISO|nr:MULTISPECIES: fimbria/pilus periplasmic chaperone [Enterobacteriaceae]RDZ23968.1 molecular chaperone [Enterobacter sp. EC-NT1]HDR9912481.1 fimbria/pilus periplasmic chaperone [Escherichia coli 92.0144 (F03)]EEW8994030.1 molecular chaperone [Escherichia coli]EFC7945319.1 fimbria/pilus periplasmic chaperone [Escherichia coli]EFF0492874.1 fimbria/pilus periplasmic chaperone [Escherichia coli]